MHLLVLSAFRLKSLPLGGAYLIGLNAPSGAQCFPTAEAFTMFTNIMAGLNAPSGAQCFPTQELKQMPKQELKASQCTFWCSVLSDNDGPVLNEVLSASQCTFWCSVLSDGEEATHVLLFDASQCTFWCSVLSDPEEKSPFIFYVVRSQCTFWCSVLSDTRKCLPRR